MKKALISTLEPRETGYRVAQVEPADQIFNVADWLFWTDCEDNVIADLFWYDPKDQSIQPLPVPILTIIKNNFTAIVTTSTPHSLKTNDIIILTEQEPIEYQGEYKITVIDDVTFSYETNIEPSTDATKVGKYSVNY